MYRLGRLLRQHDEHEEAAHWLRDGAASGDPRFFGELGLLLEQTERFDETPHPGSTPLECGDEDDREDALTWLRIAAGSDDAEVRGTSMRWVWISAAAARALGVGASRGSGS